MGATAHAGRKNCLTGSWYITYRIFHSDRSSGRERTPHGDEEETKPTSNTCPDQSRPGANVARALPAVQDDTAAGRVPAFPPSESDQGGSYDSCSTRS